MSTTTDKRVLRGEYWRDYKTLYAKAEKMIGVKPTKKNYMSSTEELKRGRDELKTLTSTMYRHNVEVRGIDSNGAEKKFFINITTNSPDRLVPSAQLNKQVLELIQRSFVGNEVWRAQSEWVNESGWWVEVVSYVKETDQTRPVQITDVQSLDKVLMYSAGDNLLTYPNQGIYKDLEKKVPEEKCVYYHLSQDLGITYDEINTILEKKFTESQPQDDFGLTSLEVIKVFAEKKAQVVIIDIMENKIAEHRLKREEQTTAFKKTVFVYMCCNSHLYKPDAEFTKRFLARRSLHNSEVLAISEEEKHMPISNEKDATEVIVYMDEHSGIVDHALKIVAERNAIINVAGLEQAIVDARKELDEFKNRPRPVKSREYRKISKEDKALARRANTERLDELNKKVKDAEYALKNMKADKKRATGLPTYVIAITSKVVGGGVKNLMYIWTSLIANYGTVYKSNLKESVITKINMGRDVYIRAVGAHTDIQSSVSAFGLEYTHQSVVGLSAQTWELAKKKLGWEKSVPNQEVFKFMERGFFTMGGINHIFEDYEVEQEGSVKGIDFYRQYASKSLEGNFYKIDMLSEITVFDGKIEPGFLYLVELQTANVLFKRQGSYEEDYIRVGIANGLITKKDIRYKLSITKSPMIDNTLKTYVKDTYSKVKDSIAKQMVNNVIGLLGRATNRGEYKSAVCLNSNEVSYFYTKMKSNTIKANVSVDYACTYKGQQVQLIQGYEEVPIIETDILVNMAIVQRSRLQVFELMLKVKAMSKDTKILHIRTDSVKYVSSKTYPVATKPTFGDVRVESCEHKKGYKFVKTEFKKGEKIKAIKSFDWKIMENISNTEYFDAGRLLKFDGGFINGFAGSGKTHILNDFAEKCRAQGLRVQMTSYTHVASMLLDKGEGQTLHATFKIDRTGKPVPSQLEKLIQDCDVLLIDEVSMIPMSIYRTLSLLPKSVKVFGFGDFRQISPVGEENINYGETQMFKSIFRYNRVDLKKQCRADAEFADQCVAYRDGKRSELPDGLNVIDSAPNTLSKNIFARNEPRKKHSREVLKSEGERRGLTECTRRICVEQDDKPYQHSAWELFNGSKLAELVRNKAKYESKCVETNYNIGCDGEIKKDDWDVFKIAEKYLFSAEHVEGDIWRTRVIYTKSQTSSIGRFFAKGARSLQTINKWIRHTIAGDMYTDIDIVNAHVVIIQHMARKDNLIIPYIDELVADRDAIFVKLMNRYKVDRDHIKRVILAMLNGGTRGYKDLVKLHGVDSWMEGYMRETFALRKYFTTGVHKERFDIATAQRIALGKTKRHEASYLNKLLCDWENTILMSMLDCLKKSGLVKDTYVLCFDGIMVPNDDKINLLEIERHVQVALGINIKLSTKKMDMIVPLEKCEQYKGMTQEELPMRCVDCMDEFQYLFEGMDVISNKTTEFAKNNETYRLTRFDFEHKHDTTRGKKVKKIVKSEVLYSVELTNSRHTIIIPETKFRKVFSPAYAITSHKAQGLTFNEPYYIHEWDRMLPEQKYVALTRTTNPSFVNICKKL